jgi:hypothetical protein
MTDHKQMRRTLLDALETQELLSEIEEIILKPSHFTLIDSTNLFRRCKTAIETLSHLAEENASTIKG